LTTTSRLDQSGRFQNMFAASSTSMWDRLAKTILRLKLFSRRSAYVTNACHGNTALTFANTSIFAALPTRPRCKTPSGEQARPQPRLIRQVANRHERVLSNPLWPLPRVPLYPILKPLARPPPPLGGRGQWQANGGRRAHLHSFALSNLLLSMLSPGAALDGRRRQTSCRAGESTWSEGLARDSKGHGRAHAASMSRALLEPSATRHKKGTVDCRGGCRNSRGQLLARVHLRHLCP